MKKTRLQLIPFLLAVAAVTVTPRLAGAQNSSVQIYGIVDVAYRHTSNEGSATNQGQSLQQLLGGGMSQSRWGINVSEDLGGGLKVLANLENRFSADTGVANYSQLEPYFQQSWVGVHKSWGSGTGAAGSGWGRLTLGRQYNVLFDLVTSTYPSYPYSPYMDAYKPEMGFALGARQDNLLKYTAEVGPLRGALQYSFGEKNPLGGKTLGAYVRYAASGWAAGVGYQNYAFASGKKLTAWTLGGSYRADAWYFNLGYGQNKVDPLTSPVDMALLGAVWQGNTNGGFAGPAFLAANQRTLYKVGVGYQLTQRLNLGAHYFHARQSGRTAAAEASANFFTLAADYAFSKRTDAYLEADHTRLQGQNVSLTNTAGVENGAKRRTGFTIGLRHRF